MDKAGSHRLHGLARRCALLLLLLAGSCSRETLLPPPDAYPQNLSAWHMVWKDGDALRIHPQAVVYDLNTPLFSDYALKLRTLYVPAGQAATYHPQDTFDFPVGTVITKTFFYERSGEADLRQSGDWPGDPAAVDFSAHRIMETRVLVRQAHGWDALPYVWDGEDAYLAITGRVIPVTLDGQALPYVVPSRNECASCHVTDHTAKTMLPIGLKARHLNRMQPPGGHTNQLALLAERGSLRGLPADAEAIPRAAAMDDTGAALADRARAYLDANCGHCHNARGAADTSGLLLDALTDDVRHLGQCKPPIAAGRGTGGRTYGIVPGQPDASILLWRMETADPATRMPETGRSLVHTEGVALVRAWIEALPGNC